MSFLTSADLLQSLRKGRRMLADGAVGTELMRLDLPADGIVEANLSCPLAVTRLHRRAIEAGAQIITTNTFGSPDSIGWEAAFRAGVEIAITAANEAAAPIAVMLSVYPGELLRAPEVVLGAFDRSDGCDCLLLIETVTDIREATAAVALARSHSETLVAATCHFQASGGMPDGTTPSEAAIALQEAGASLVGANCGTVPEAMATVAIEMRRTAAATGRPLGL
jgi:methionine synthase I (cobalamin-dependent)